MIKRAFIVLLALLMLTACAKETADITEAKSDNTISEQATQAAKTTSATSVTESEAISFIDDNGYEDTYDSEIVNSQTQASSSVIAVSVNTTSATASDTVTAVTEATTVQTVFSEETTALSSNTTLKANNASILTAPDGKKYCAFLVAIDKIYWNEFDADKLEISEGNLMKIYLPYMFSEWFTSADDMMMYTNSCDCMELLDEDGSETSFYYLGIGYTQYWSTDFLCPIKNDIVEFGEYTDEMLNTYNTIDDGVYIEEANNVYSDAPFENHMTAAALDAYFEKLYDDTLITRKLIADNPDTDYELSGYFGYQDGVRFRAEIVDIL